MDHAVLYLNILRDIIWVVLVRVLISKLLTMSMSLSLSTFSRVEARIPQSVRSFAGVILSTSTF